MRDLFATIRARCAEVVKRARWLRVDAEGVAALAERLGTDEATPPAWDAETHHRGSDASTLAYVLTLGATNFGSGWFPRLRKRPGRSGYFTLALALKDRFDARGPWTPRELVGIEPGELAGVLGQDPLDPDVGELLALMAEALGALGQFLIERHAGRWEGPVEAAGGRAEALVGELAHMPFFRDVAHYQELEVPFYKRAQLTASDLALAFQGCGPGRFRDLPRLTAFADNLVPHVLRMEGVLVYDPGLRRRIESGLLLAAGSAEEVEIRAAAVHGVELLVESLRRRGHAATAWELDNRLWLRGQRPEHKARPRHRTRTVYY